MKIRTTAKLQVLALCEPTKSSDGKTNYYKVTVMQGQEAGQVSVDENVYCMLEVGRTADLVCEYRDDYKSFKIVGFDYNAPATPHPATAVPTDKADKPNKGDK